MIMTMIMIKIMIINKDSHNNMITNNDNHNNMITNNDNDNDNDNEQ